MKLLQSANEAAHREIEMVEMGDCSWLKKLSKSPSLVWIVIYSLAKREHSLWRRLAVDPALLELKQLFDEQYYLDSGHDYLLLA